MSGWRSGLNARLKAEEARASIEVKERSGLGARMARLATETGIAVNDRDDLNDRLNAIEAHSYSNGLLPTLYGYYKCDDATSAILTDSHGSNDLSINATWASHANAKLGTARLSNDIGQLATTGSIAAGAFSISGWFDPSGGNNSGTVLSALAGAVHIHVEMNGGTSLVLWAGSNQTAAGTASTGYSHYLLTYDGGTGVKFYLDGGAPVSLASSAAFTGTMTLRIGSIEGVYIDECAMWTSELGQDEATLLWNGGSVFPYESFT